MPASLSPSPCPVPIVCLPSAGLDQQPAMSQPVFSLESPRIASTAPPRSRSQTQMQTPGSASKRFARTAADSTSRKGQSRQTLAHQLLAAEHESTEARQALKGRSQAAESGQMLRR